MQVTVAVISATIPKGNSDDSDIDDLPKEHMLPKDLEAEWSMEKLFYTNSNPEKTYKGIYMAAPTNIYDYVDYWQHVPTKIRNSIPSFKEMYLKKHYPNQKLLKLEHILVSFISFKCNLVLDDNDEVNEHFEDTYGVKGGPTRLLPFQEIAVNEQLPFEIQKLGDIENYGMDKKLEIVRGLYIYCQSRGVINRTNDKSEVYLSEPRSKEFMKELEKACSDLFFSRVVKYIREKVKKDVRIIFL